MSKEKNTFVPPTIEEVEKFMGSFNEVYKLLEGHTPYRQCVTVTEIAEFIGIKKTNAKDIILYYFSEDMKEKLKIHFSNGWRLHPVVPINYKEKASTKNKKEKEKIYIEATNGEDEGVTHTLARIINNEIHLTYKSHIDPKDLLCFISKVLPKAGIYYYSIVNETSTKLIEYEHTHALFVFSSDINISMTDLDYKGIHPHVKIPRKPPGGISHRIWKGSASYIAATYHRKESGVKILSTYPIATIPKYKVILGESKIVGYEFDPKDVNDSNLDINLLAELMLSQEPSPDRKSVTKVAARIELDKSIKPTLPPEKIHQLYPWQSTTLDILNRFKSDRTIMWIYDSSGKNGKSTFSKYLEDNKRTIRLGDVNVDRDLLNILCNEIRNKGAANVDTIIFDVARNEETTSDKHKIKIKTNNEHGVEKKYKLEQSIPYYNPKLFTLIEQIKDGRITNKKFKTDISSLKPKINIIITSNFIPYIETVTKDRWLICTMGFNQEFDQYIGGQEIVQRIINYELLKDNNGKMAKHLPIERASMILGSDQIKEFFWSKGLMPRIDTHIHYMHSQKLGFNEPQYESYSDSTDDENDGSKSTKPKIKEDPLYSVVDPSRKIKGKYTTLSSVTYNIELASDPMTDDEKEQYKKWLERKSEYATTLDEDEADFDILKETFKDTGHSYDVCEAIYQSIIDVEENNIGKNNFSKQAISDVQEYIDLRRTMSMQNIYNSLKN